MGRGKTVEDWDAWTEKMKAAHGNGNGHGKSLEIETARIGAATTPQSPDGNTSPDEPHQHQLSLDVQGIPA
jgi:DNA (cytosine-5)-methyltransferase 1